MRHLIALLSLILLSPFSLLHADLFLGDWEGKTLEGNPLVAQVIPRAEATYSINILPSFDQRVKAYAQVEGKVESGILRFDQSGWAATVTKSSFKGIGILNGQPVTFRLKPVVRKSPRLGAKPPKDAIVLFDGSGFDQWENPDEITWEIKDGVAIVRPNFDEHGFGKAIRTKQAFPNFQLHVEFKLPLLAKFTGQNRGNSGVIIEEFQFYEVQVLDTYGLEGKDDECGGIYKAGAPSINMCRPPLQWQSYDITYHGPKIDASGKLVQKAKITVNHNGILVHENRELPFSDKALKRRLEKPNSKKPGRITLQHHGDPIQYRNVWVVDLSGK